MVAQTDTGGSPVAYAWLTGAVAGVISAVLTALVLLGFDRSILVSGIPAVVDASGLAAGFAVMGGIGLLAGLGYVALAQFTPLARYARVPDTGAPLGLAYGLLLWLVAALAVPLALGTPGLEVGTYGVTLQGVVSFALFGTVIGLVYGMSPYTA